MSTSGRGQAPTPGLPRVSWWYLAARCGPTAGLGGCPRCWFFCWFRQTSCCQKAASRAAPRSAAISAGGPGLPGPGAHNVGPSSRVTLGLDNWTASWSRLPPVTVAAGHRCRWSRLPPGHDCRLVTVAAWSQVPLVTTAAWLPQWWGSCSAGWVLGREAWACPALHWGGRPCGCCSRRCGLGASSSPGGCMGVCGQWRA